MNYGRLTESDLELEREITIQTRLGILCGDKEPTDEQMDIAMREANAQILALRKQQS